MNKLKMHSKNFVNENIAKIAELFPNCVTEVKSEENPALNLHPSSLSYAIDFDLLRQELATEVVEGPQERYHLNWPGKREALLTANAPIAKTLRPCREESVEFDATENLFIEGNNLDALKLLQETYLGKVKMIYIDPPYNTGKDFIYKDQWTMENEEWKMHSGDYDEDGNRLVANTDSNGRFHSDWLSMMYPRLKLARNLLKDDGVIFISIDDGEQANLKKLCDEIFGEHNSVGEIMVVRAEGGGLAKQLVKGHDNLHIYAKDIENFEPLRRPKNIRGQKVIRNGEEYWVEEDWLRKEFGKYGTCSYNEIEKYHGQRKKTEIDQGLTDGSYTLLKKKGDTIVGRYRKISEDGSKFYSILKHLNKNGVEDLKSLDLHALFDFPKPLSLVKEILLGCTFFQKDKDSIILDFFAGSATTAHAVMQLNAEDGGNRKFIMVQLPEACDEKSEAFKAGYETIAEISKERIRRAGKEIKDELRRMQDEEKARGERRKDELGLFKDSETHLSSFSPHPSSLDTGFRVLKVDSSNMADVYYTPDAVEQNHLSLLTDNIKDNRTSEDLLFQVLLDWGVDLTLPISKETFTTKNTKSTKEKKYEVFFVDGNALAACFEKDGKITEDFCKELARRQPLRVVFRDSGFKDDSVKINVEQIFKLMSPHTYVKSI